MNKRIEQLQQRYLELTHAMQTGVACKIQVNATDTEPKHLRVGINTALVESWVIARLLLQKGIITEEEYWQEMCDQMEREVEVYKRRLGADFKAEVELR